jgi:hypothetical protein
MDFGSTLTNPLLQLAVNAGEPVIYRACDAPPDLQIHAGMSRYADGRDAIQITLRTSDRVATFSMLLQKFFEREVLDRVTRRAWQLRTAAESQRRSLNLDSARRAAAMN